MSKCYVGIHARTDDNKVNKTHQKLILKPMTHRNTAFFGKYYEVRYVYGLSCKLWVSTDTKNRELKWFAMSVDLFSIYYGIKCHEVTAV